MMVHTIHPDADEGKLKQDMHRTRRYIFDTLTVLSLLLLPGVLVTVGL